MSWYLQRGRPGARDPRPAGQLRAAAGRIAGTQFRLVSPNWTASLPRPSVRRRGPRRVHAPRRDRWSGRRVRRRRSAHRWSSRRRSGGCVPRERAVPPGDDRRTARGADRGRRDRRLPRPAAAARSPRDSRRRSSSSTRTGTGTRRPCRRARCSSWDRDSRASRSPRSSGGRPEGLPVGRQRGPVPAALPRRATSSTGWPRSRERGEALGDPATDGRQAAGPAPSAGREPALLGPRRRSRHEPPPVRGRGDDAARPDRGRRRSTTPISRRT